MDRTKAAALDSSECPLTGTDDQGSLGTLASGVIEAGRLARGIWFQSRRRQRQASGRTLALRPLAGLRDRR